MRKFSRVTHVGNTFDGVYIEITDVLLDHICTMPLLGQGQNYAFKPEKIYSQNELPTPCVFFKLNASKIDFHNFSINLLYWEKKGEVTVRYLND